MTVSAPPIAVHGLRKRFGSVLAVDDVSFEVGLGEVCGLLGPNGAGKTTTLRLLTGLERPTQGKASLFGVPAAPGNPELTRVGAMIEESAFVPHLSGMTNLRLWWEAGGGRFSEADVDGALAIADLGDALARRVRTYSRGMKQRLGLARLLLGRPEVLILDEPTDGLDPEEIRAIRGLIQRLAAAGATVLLSSHHLAEVEQVCSHAVIMNRGRVVAQGTVAGLIGSSGTVYLEVDDPARATSVLEGLTGVVRVVPEGDGLAVELRDGRRSDLVAALVAAGLRVETVMATQRLEDAFLRLLDTDSGATPDRRS